VFGVAQDVHAPLPALHLPLAALLHVGLVRVCVCVVRVWLGVCVCVNLGVCVGVGVGVHLGVGVAVWLGINLGVVARVRVGISPSVVVVVVARVSVHLGVGLPLVGGVVGLARVQRLARTVDAPIARGAIVRGRASAL
jgi:hypothetical protein